MGAPRVIPRERLVYVEKLYLDGVSDQRIQTEAAAAFGVTRRQVRTYLARVRAKLAALPKPPPEAAFARTEAMLLETYGLARRGKKFLVVSQGKGEPAQIEERDEANVGVMATVAWRLAELYGVASSKVTVQVDGLAGFLATGFTAPPETK